MRAGTLILLYLVMMTVIASLLLGPPEFPEGSDMTAEEVEAMHRSVDLLGSISAGGLLAVLGGRAIHRATKRRLRHRGVSP